MHVCAVCVWFYRARVHVVDISGMVQMAVTTCEHMLIRDQGPSTSHAEGDNPGELVRDGLNSAEDPISRWTVWNAAITIGC